MGAGRLDRRAIEPLLGAFFPDMRGKTSTEWQAFLNAETGLQIALDEPNPSAFDAWRKALSEGGLPVWGVSPERQAQIDERAAKIAEAEAKRQAGEAARLAELRNEAPDVKAKDLLK